MSKEDDKAGDKAGAPRSFARRDHLRANELRIQEQWAASKIYEVEPIEGRETFFLNFPYPYMNGRLHLGHAFSLTKAEFTARFQRLQGKNVLFPFGFHCTGMPIQAAANKLKEEIRQFGNPPVFPTAEELEAAEATKRGDKATAPADEGKDAAAQIAAKSKGKKSKLIAKGAAGTPMRQWDILAKMVPEDEIASFVDPLKWLNYFPPYGASDLIAFGSAIDWRRSFITTSVNPYYDKFIRWQFNKLKESGRIKFGKRANVFSPLDQQVCADHDRASGENVGPQEYTIIKLLIVQPYPENCPLNHESLVGRNVYLAPATLRPETMYGQTNCFVLPEGDYGAFELHNGDVFVISKRSAIGMAHQDLMKEWGKVTSLVDMKGQDLIGLPLKAPNAAYDVVYTLPLTTISMNKGTGVVTSVPSDAPDDYAALRELQEKPLWREKFGVTAEMVEPFAVVPIIEIPGYGPASAVTMCEKLDIKSSKDKDKLKAAKDEVYLKGFYEGRMTVGECKGMTVQDAKPIIRQQLIDSGDAVPYYEPESLVMSRSGDECVVALTDQWYLSYGAEDWCNTVKAHIHSEDFNMYNGKIMEKFDQVLDWLGEWACSRQFGLGTLMPWDEQWVIESLSDSTIYMAYYTIAQHFHGSLENLNGTSNPNPKINADHLCDEVFDYIFLEKPLPEGFTTPIPESLLASMRNEFEYWYPFNLRVSAKDLIPNHLTMCLYNHVEIWKDRPELWPKGIYCNGHIQVDAEKMSKSKGNFLMLLECIEDFSADATRFACADAGDSMEDANFDRSVANNSISYLFTEEEYCKSVSSDAKDGKFRSGEMTFMDKCFNNEMDHLIEATFQEFDKMCYRDGIHRCWYDLLIARDLYRDWSTKCGIAYHQDVITRFVRIIAVMMAPITPHWSEVIWEVVILPESEGPKSASVVDARWPSFSQFDRQLRKEYLFFRDALKNMRQNQMKTKLAKGAPISAYIYYSSAYDENKVQMLTWLQSQYDLNTKSFPATLSKDMKAWCESIPELKPQTKVLMQFGAFMRNEALDRGSDALAIDLPFDQVGILKANEVYIVKSLNLATLTYHDVNAGGEIPGEKKKYNNAVPGNPTFHFFNEK
jgi:leucyl-tRNA synthetase